MKDLHALGLNPFAVQLLAESMLKSAYVKHCGTQPLTFNFPVQREDCAGWLGVRITIEAVSAKEQPQAQPFGYVSQHTNGLWEFSPTMAGVYPDTAKSITAVYAKQPQAEAVRSDQEIVDQTEELAAMLLSWAHGREAIPGTTLRNSEHPRAKSCWQMACRIQEFLTLTDPENAVAEVDGMEEAAPQQAESAPDVVRDAERYRWLFSSHTEAELAECDQKSLQPPHTKQDETLALLGGWYATKEQADKAIDAAIAAQKASAQ